MAKSTAKKKNRKLRKQVRKTIGALLMASSIAVAAIPVQDVEATPEQKATKIALQHAAENGVSIPANTADIQNAEVKDYVSSVPSVFEYWVQPDEKVVYTTGDGKFQFVYMRPNSTDTNKYAVILGYNSSSGDNSTLEIPKSLIAYKKYSDNVSTEGYCLVSKNGGYLYYEDEAQKIDPDSRGLLYIVPELKDDDDKPIQVTQFNNNLVNAGDGKWIYRNQEQQTVDKDNDGAADMDEDSNLIYETVWVDYEARPLMETVYSPCYYEQRGDWESISDENLYYRDSSNTYVKAGTNNAYWKIVADVAYIGKDIIVSDGAGGWDISPTVAPSTGNGVFKNAGNVQNLIIGGNIWGIGDYAFSGCSNLQSVTLGDNLQTVGNGAFANCIRLTDCNVAINARLQAIGKDAFYKCSSLRSFTAPINLQAIGDSCFEECTSLQSVELCGGDGGAVALARLGDHVFKNCSSLPSLEFPSNYTESNLDIDMFEGCSSLQFIKVNNGDVNLSSWHPGASSRPYCTEFDFEDFKNTVLESFYFEGPATSKIHTTATDQSIAFKYLGQDLYEKIEYEHNIGDPAGTENAKVTYQVNSNNELVNFWIEQGDKPDNVTIPEKIGPYGISSIAEGSFNDNCDLVKITIPASVTYIGDNAFKGCHNLRTVMYTDASTIQHIGTDAFKTQEITCGCTLAEDNPGTEENEGPELTFVGAMINNAGNDTVPFMYAMNGISNINNANQEKTWITCHSGWPTNLEVQYAYDPITNTGEAQLIGYPRYEMIDNAAKAAEWVHNLPYVTSENEQEYLDMVLNATAYYEADDKTGLQQPTENEMAIVNSALNVVIPTSVDSIKDGLFSGYTYDEETGEAKALADGTTPDTYIQSVVLNGVDEIEPYTFKGCESLRETAIIGPTYIGNYAYDECTNLETATLGTNLADTGKRPFSGCDSLVNVNCMDSDFMYGEGVLYRNTPEGVEIVECLESRGAVGGIGSYSVGPDELIGVTTMKEEAFADCDAIGKVDLSSTTVDVIPEGCFKDTDDLNSVVLPDTVKNIEAESFRDSGIRLLTIPGNQAYIAPDAFATSEYLETGDKDTQQTIIFECLEGLTADRYAKETEYWYINPEYGKVFLEHDVYFWDYPNYPDTSTKELFYKIKVKDGEDAVPPTDIPLHDGYQFSRWTDYTNISKETDVYPVFGYNVYAVQFLDWDGSLIGEIQYIEEGKSAIPPADPVRDGYTFTGWSKDWNNVTEDRTITAVYSDNSGDSNRHTVTFYDYDGNVHSQQTVNHGEGAVEPKDPVKSGYRFLGWTPSDYSNITQDTVIMSRWEKIVEQPGNNNPNNNSGNNNSGNNNNNNATPAPTAAPRKYTVSVSGGSGSGQYEAGQVVVINAFDRGEGQNFDKWTSSTAGVGFANPNAVSTTFTMPAANVAVTATYKTGGSTVNNNNTGSSGGSTGGSNYYNPGTTVQVTKPGISNTNLAGATVSGATDNFIVKVTEDQNATNAVVAALQGKYGDISRLKYQAMDISLYDSTGRTKIADTSGISVNITLPLPDDLIQYAGNNKVAVVRNGVLEDLNTRFTTVDGVPCVNFTASHFSPYVIYVDTANLTQGTIDATPKTGDPIHPKWFLAIGMACISLILFFKRDKKVVINSKLA